MWTPARPEIDSQFVAALHALYSTCESNYLLGNYGPSMPRCVVTDDERQLEQRLDKIVEQVRASYNTTMPSNVEDAMNTYSGRTWPSPKNMLEQRNVRITVLRMIAAMQP